MALTFRIAVAADLPALVALRDANKADLIADYGSLVEHSAADMLGFLADGSWKIIVADNNGVIVGALLAMRHFDGRWELLLAVTAASLTPAQRLARFKSMTRWAADHVADDVVIFGRVKAGRRLDLAMQSSPFTRTDLGGGYIEYSATALVIRGVY